MWLKEVLIVQLIVLQNIISSQPLIESEKNRQSRQTRFEECCPCPSVSEGADFRDQDSLPSQRSSYPRMPLDDCPCRSGFDNEGSSSIFYPSFLRGAQPTDRSPEVKQEPKPLLRPEVGLASSVLETLKEATDEEYEAALLRDATRTALKTAEPAFLDTEPGTTKQSVTIVINPRDLDDGDDAISEASHAHETRCIHSPLRSSNFENSRRIALPRLSKEYSFLPKSKFREPLRKSLFDMDNSPSNIQENFDVLDRKDLGNKLKINPSLLSGITGSTDELRNSRGKPGTKLRMTPEQCDDISRRSKLNNSPMLSLAAFKNKLRDLSEMRNTKRLNNNLQAGPVQDHFKVIDTKRDDETKTLSMLKLPPFDKQSSVAEKQSSLVKNILKLRDVELLPPRKHKQSDLKAAGTENKADIVMSSKIPNEKNSNECDGINRSFSDELTSEEPRETEPKSVTSDISTSSLLLAGSQEDDEASPINDSSNEIEILNSSAENDLEDNVKTDFPDEIFNIDDQQNNKADENIDSEPESTNVLQQIDQDDESTQNNNLYGEANESNEDDCYNERFSTVTPLNLPTNIDEKGKHKSLSAARERSQHSSLKDDILRTLENLRNTVQTNFAEKKPDNFKNTQLTPTTSASIITPNENPVETKDLQKLSDFLLNQELSRTKSVAKKAECITNDESSNNNLSNNESNEISYFTVNNNESSSSELHDTSPQFNASGVPSQNVYKLNLIDRVNTALKPLKQNDLSNLQIPEHTCGAESNEGYEVTDEDILPQNEMSSQASNIQYNALRPHARNNHLKSSLPQDTEEPLILNENDLKKPFQIPSLEEIRQSITNIIDAGQREEEDLRLIDPDPLKESSNINLMRLSDTNLRTKLPNSGHRLIPNIERNSLMQRLNLNSHKSILDFQDYSPFKPLKLPSIQNNRAGIFGDYLSSGKDTIKSLSMSKSALNVLGTPVKETPTLDKIRDSLNSNTKNLFREVPFRVQQLPINNIGSQSVNSLKNGFKSYADNTVKRVQSGIKDITVGNQGTLSKSQIDANNIVETIARRREDMKEKLQALHIDFNDRLATIHDRLLDQTNSQSINIPAFKESSNVINLPVIGCEQENNLNNLVSGRQPQKDPNNFMKLKYPLKQDHKFISPKSLAPKDSKTLSTLKYSDDHGFIRRQNAEFLDGSPLLNMKKLSNLHKMEKIEAQRKNLEKQRGSKPLSNGHFKVSFSSSTVMPMTKQNAPTPNYAKKHPLGVLKQNNNHEKENTVHSKLKAISSALRTRMNNFEDSKHSPSELVPFRMQSTEKSFDENKVIKNLRSETDVNSAFLPTTTRKPSLGSKNAIPKSVLDAKNAQLVKSVAPLAKENQFVTNIREALRSRSANITPLTSLKDKHGQKPLLDAVESPSENQKTVQVLNNPLKENTSYKCKMMCVRE